MKTIKYSTGINYKSWYLIPQVGVPDDDSCKRSKHIAIAKCVAKSVGLFLRTILVSIHSDKPQFEFYLFRLPYYKDNYTIASRFVKSFYFAISLLYGPFRDIDRTSLVLRLPSEFINNKDNIKVEDLINFSKKMEFQDRNLLFPYLHINYVSIIPSCVIKESWEITKIIYENDKIHRSLTFFDSNQNTFWIAPGQHYSVLENYSALPENSMVQEKRESALQNVFKAIEAIIGDPSKDDNKFYQKLNSFGIDPQMQVGFNKKDTIANTIREMNKARDKKSAHGSTPNRDICVGELYNYQECAKLIIEATIENISKINTIAL